MPSPRPRWLAVEEFGDMTVVRLVARQVPGENDMLALGEQLFSLVDDIGRRTLVFDFGGMESLAIAVMDTMVTLNAQLQNVGGRLLLRNIHPRDYEALVILKLHKLIDMEAGTADDDPPTGPGGVRSRLGPRNPSGGQSAALRPPRPEPE